MRIRPQGWRDFFAQFAGRDGSADPNAWPIPVALWHDGSALSTREPAPYAVSASLDGGPGAGNHTGYVWTPTIASKPLVIRICFARFSRETATSFMGWRVGAATATAASNAVFTTSDVAGAALTIVEIANANLPLTLFNSRPATDLPDAIYPRYVAEFIVPPGSVLEVINRTQDDTTDAAFGWYTLPVV